MGLKVLIVDDAAFMRMVLRNIFARAGCEVVGEAASGKEAVEKFDALQPDLVTMDMTMPEMDGISAVRLIKQKHPLAKIIMVSAMGQQALVVEAIKAGALDFIVKPFQEEVILEKLKKVI